MCLNFDYREMKKVRGRLKRHKFIYCWKVLEYGSNASPYYYQTYHVGWNKSNRQKRKLTKNEMANWTVSEGIHVYLNYSQAQSATAYSWNRKAVKIKCFAKDFVASSRAQAVFTKVFVPKGNL